MSRTQTGPEAGLDAKPIAVDDADAFREELIKLAEDRDAVQAAIQNDDPEAAADALDRGEARIIAILSSWRNYTGTLKKRGDA